MPVLATLLRLSAAAVCTSASMALWRGDKGAGDSCKPQHSRPSDPRGPVANGRSQPATPSGGLWPDQTQHNTG